MKQTDKTDTDREGLMKTKLCKSTTIYILYEVVSLVWAAEGSDSQGFGNKLSHLSFTFQII